MDFDNPKVYGDTSITDGLVFTVESYILLLGNYFKKWKMMKIDFLQQLLQNWSQIDFVKSVY